MNRGSDGAAFAPGAAGQATASNLPPHLARPEVRAALEATRAKFAMQQQQQQNGSSGLGATLPASAYQQQQQQQQGSIPAGRGPAIAAGRSTEQQQQQQQQQAGAYRVNPMFGEAAVLSPDKKVDREYTPRLADAIRTPSLDALVPGASLPPVGDLFADQPELPLSAEAVQHTAPKLPDWDTQRASLTGRSLWDEAVAHSRAGGAAKEDDSKPQVLETYPPHVQESLLVDDLLSAFMGENGSYVRAKLLHAPGGTRLGFEVVGRGQLEAALQEMTARMLPLCEYAAVIQRFVETRRRYAWGLVCQALAGAMRHVLQDWHLMVAQLEHQLRSGKLTLHALWYYVQPPMSALKLVASLAAEASFGRLRGAGLLDLLHSRCAAAMGDAAAHRLALRLLKAAAEPYFSMLERWLCEGAVDDPYAEFMVVQDASIQRESLNADNQSAFWHDRYTLRLVYAPATAEGPEQPPPTPALGQQQPMQQQGRHPPPQQYDVPAFLMRQRDLILNTGKYLNVMRECGTKPPRTLPLGTRLEYEEGSKCVLAIEDAHTTASSAAMELLRRRENLAGGLAVLKRYFLAAQGDMLLHLMDAAEPELHAFVGNVPLLQLQSLLDSAVRGSSAASDPAAARLAVAFDHRSILNMLIANQQALALVPGAEASSKTPFSKLKPTTPAPMTASERNNIGKKRSARESFMLSYEVPWPLSIAAPQAALAQYQMVFRHIFELKWVERELTRVAALYQQTAGLANRRVRMRRASLGGGSRLSAGGGDQLSEALAQSCAACQLMTHFFRQYLMYVTFEVMEPLWAAFEAKLQTASSLDEIVEQHKAFLRRLMKGCLLSRKVVVLRALLGLKDLALRFVRLSDDTASLKWDALEEEAEQRCMGTGRKAEGRREQRLLKTSLARAQLELQLSRPEVAAGIRDLRTKFLAKAGEFMAALADAHRTAHSERSDTREELESLLNLMSRLDFNGYFSAQPRPAARPAPAAGLASGGGDRMTVRFGAAA